MDFNDNFVSSSHSGCVTLRDSGILTFDISEYNFKRFAKQRIIKHLVFDRHIQLIDIFKQNTKIKR